MKDTSVDVVVDLASAREKYLAEQEMDCPNVLVKFTYAKALTHDEKKENKVRGIGLLIDILDDKCINLVECLYCLATTYYELMEYGNSRKYCEKLLRIDPSHKKATELHKAIKEKMVKDDAIGLGMLAGAIVLAVFLPYIYILNQQGRILIYPSDTEKQ